MTPAPQAGGYFQHSDHTAVRGRGQSVSVGGGRQSLTQLSNSRAKVIEDNTDNS